MAGDIGVHLLVVCRKRNTILYTTQHTMASVNILDTSVGGDLRKDPRNLTWSPLGHASIGTVVHVVVWENQEG